MKFCGKEKKCEQRFNPSNYGSGPGQIFDMGSYSGNILAIIFSILVIFVGGHIDEIGRWLWHQFGEELIVSPAQEAWHRMIARAMGVIGIVSSLINMHNVFKGRKKLLTEKQTAAPHNPQ